MTRGMNGSDVKRSNRGLFLKNIALGTANTRVALSKITGLAKMTAGNIVQELIAMGLVEESGPVYDGTTGPAAQRLVISEKAPKIVGIYLSRDEIIFSTGDLSGNILYKKAIPLFEENQSSLTAKIIDGTAAAVKNQNGNILAIGVAMIGPIDAEGSIVDSPNFFGIKKLEVKKILTTNFPYPTTVYNDISAAAVAEQLIGKSDYQSFIFIGNSNGLGAGIIYNGELMTAKSSFVGEFGHVTIDINGPKCPCGNTGCLELYANTTVLCQRLSDAINQKVEPTDFENLSDNKICDKIFNDTADKLATGMITLTNLLRPEAFIIGYNGYYLPQKYINRMEKKINATKFLKDGNKTYVNKAILKDESAIYGSIASVLREVFKGKILFNNP